MAADEELADEEIDRTTAHRELVRVRGSIDRIRALYLAIAIITGLLATLMGFIAFRGGDRVEPVVAWVTFLVLAGITVLFLVGRQRVRHQPYFWGVLIASLVTLVVVLEWGGFLSGNIEFSRALIVHTAIAIGAWGAAATLANVKKMMDAHPELRIAKRIRGEDTRVSTTRGEIGEREPARRQQAKRNRLIGVGIGAAALVALFLIPPLFSEATAGGGNHSGTTREPRPEITASFDEIRAQFEAAWEAKDIAAIGELYPPEKARYRRRLAARFDKHDLNDFPPLGEPAVRKTMRTRRDLTYPRPDGGTVRFEIEYLDDRWVMNRLIFKD